MFLSTIKVLFRHKWQAIPNTDKVSLPAPFRGVPQLSSAGLSGDKLTELVGLCPTGAIAAEPFSLDLGRCLFCGECARAIPSAVSFTQEHRMACSSREALVVYADKPWARTIEPRDELKIFSRSLKLRQVCAGGDGACEMELDAAGNVNFDMRRHGIGFVASPRHADGVVVTGAVTRKMAAPLAETYDAVAAPKVLIAVGADAISGGLFASAEAIDRSFFATHNPDLYVPGHPAHPLTFIDGVRRLMGQP